MYRGRIRTGTASTRAASTRDGDRHGRRAIRRSELGSSYKEKIMVRLIIAGLVAVGLSGSAWAQSMRKDCNELKTEIEAKIKKNGVEQFTLDIVDKDAQADGKVVGSCDGGTKKIVYKRGSVGQFGAGAR